MDNSLILAQAAQTVHTTLNIAQIINEWLPIFIALFTFIGFIYKTNDRVKDAIQDLKDAINMFSHKFEESQKDMQQLFKDVHEIKKVNHDHDIRITKLEISERRENSGRDR